VSKTEWIRVIGNKHAHEAIKYIGTHDDKIIIILNTIPDRPTDQNRGKIYTLSALDGVIEIEGNEFWGEISNGIETNLEVIDAFTSYQGTLVFVKTLGFINADEKLGTFTEGNRNYYYYAIIYFNLRNTMSAIVYSRSEITLTLFSMQAIKEPSDGTPATQFPNIYLLGGNNERAVLYTTRFTNLIRMATATNCEAEIITTGLCISCANRCMNQHQCRTCITGSTEYNPSPKRGCSNRECSRCRMGTGRELVGDICICENFEVEGKCQNKCNTGYKALIGKTCVMKCPDGTVMRFNPIDSEDSPFVPSHLVKFNPTQGGLRLQSPTEFTEKNFPDEWTITMWIRQCDIDHIQNLVNAFNHIRIIIESRNFDGDNYGFIATNIGEEEFGPGINSVLSAKVLGDTKGWAYVAISKGVDTAADYSKLLVFNTYVDQKVTGEERILSYRVTSGNNKANIRPTRNSLSSFLILGGDISGESMVESKSFNGYMMEFRMFLRYMNMDQLIYFKNRKYPNMRSDMLIYYHLTPDDSTYVIQEMSMTTISIETLTDTTNPSSDIVQNIPTFEIHFLETEYDCSTPLVPNKILPVIASAGEAYDVLTTITVTNTIGGITNYILKGDLELGDVIYATEADCSTGYSTSPAKKTISTQIITTNAHLLHTELPHINVLGTSDAFSKLNRGVSYRLCFKSLTFLTTHLLSWIYIVRVPETIIPLSTLVYLQWQRKTAFKLLGGDNGIDSIVYISRRITDIKGDCGQSTNVQCAKTGRKEYESTGEFVVDIENQKTFLPGEYRVYWDPGFSYKSYSLIANGLIKFRKYGHVYFCTFIM